MSAAVVRSASCGAGLFLLGVLIAGSAGATPEQQSPLTLSEPTVRGTWKESFLTARVHFSGAVSAPAQLVAVLRGTGRSIRTRRFAIARAGSFTRTIPLPKRPTPGIFQLRVSGTVGGVQSAAVTRAVTVNAPPEGIVDRWYASAARNGPPARIIRGPRSEVWAHFRFLWPPRAQTLEFVWKKPSGQRIGRVSQPYSRTIATGIGAGAALPRGTWYCIMSVGGRVAKRVGVRIR